MQTGTNNFWFYILYASTTLNITKGLVMDMQEVLKSAFLFVTSKEQVNISAK
jgi:hypothetical protein